VVTDGLPVVGALLGVERAGGLKGAANAAQSFAHTFARFARFGGVCGPFGDSLSAAILRTLPSRSRGRPPLTVSLGFYTWPL